MPLPKRLARFNLVVTNRVLGPLSRRAPGFGTVRHRGRRSGTEYATPVNVFRHGDRYAIALMYGADSQWVANVLAAGGCELETRGHDVRLVEPGRVHDETRALVPAALRPILRAVGVADFLVLRVAP